MTRRVLALAGAAVLVAGAAFYAGFRVGAADPPQGFAEVAEVAEQLQEGSARPVSDDELVRAAIRGMLDALDDPYAAFLDPQGAREARDLLSGSFVGVGMWLERSAEGLRVTSVLAGSPASEAGIVPGDLVVEADGRSLAEATLADAAEVLQGPEGSSLTLVVRDDEGDRQVELERARISLVDVQARMLRGDVAYAHPLRFGEGTTDRLREALSGLLEEGARAIVLDLRGNAGGLADEAVGTASLFLTDGPVGILRSAGGEEAHLEVEGDPLPAQVPVAVLVDGTTASAAELVAGALQDRARAVVVGTPTFGKGAVLDVQEVGGSGSAIRFTTAYFLTPDGHAIEGRGVAPDVPVLPGGPSDAQLDRAVRVLLEGSSP
jgi:carboxyl-terminal processing protease